MYGLCDCNNFFVSCERVFNPSLNGRAVVVLSSNDGCVIARSNEAKALGIKMGQPLFQVRELVDRNHVALYSCNFVLYGDMSQRVMSTLASLVPSIEIYSIDEAFLDLTGFASQDLAARGRDIARIVKRNTGMPVSIGVAPTKTLAKIASKLCKQYPKLEGCCYMHRPEDIEKVLRGFPIEDVWGVGRRYAKMLQGVGIATAYDFTQQSAQWVQAKMSIVGLRTWRELRGESCIGFEDAPAAKQQICVSRSFSKELIDFESLHAALSGFVATAAEKLRRQGSCAGELHVFIFTNRHRTDLPQQYESRLIRLEVATDSTLELISYATSALRQLFTKGYGYKKAGAILSDIIPSDAVQNTLFDTADRPKHSRLMHALDAINGHLGRDKVIVASRGFAPLQLNRDHLSQRYTTCWDEIIRVKV